MTQCLDCGLPSPAARASCGHCGGRIRGRDQRGFLWTLGAAGAVAAVLAVRPLKAALRRRRSRRSEAAELREPT